MESIAPISLGMEVTPDKGSYEELKDTLYSDILMYPLESNQGDGEFASIVFEAQLAVDCDVQAELIIAGTSGSYFTRDREKVSNY